MNKIKSLIKNSPWVIAVIYVFIGVLWIQFSDQIVLTLFDDPETITQIQSLKGWFFVFASGLLIFLLVKISNELLGGVIDDLRVSNKKFKATIENAPLGIAHHKPNEKWIEVNQALCNLLGHEREQLMQLNFSDFIHPDDLEKGRNLDQQLISGEIKRSQIEKRYIRKDGSIFTGMVHKSAVFNGGSEPSYLVVVLEDITHLKEQENQILQSLKEKEMLLSEIHHRVRNNLALISAFFDLENLHTDNQQVHRILDKNKKRIKCLALIHETFAGSERSADIRFGSLLEELTDYLHSTFSQKGHRTEFRKTITPVQLNINQAIPVSLIITELLIGVQDKLNNIFLPSLLELSLKEEDNDVLLTISVNGTDNSIGRQKNEVISNTEILSSTILQALVTQISGDLKSNTDKPGIEYSLLFEKNESRGSGSSLPSGNNSNEPSGNSE